jgi:thiopurine S-methyltransferase
VFDLILYNSSMERQYWLDRWRENRIGFHADDVNPLLQTYFAEAGGPAATRVLVPFSGKSLDIKWLADRTPEVVAVDLSEIAAHAFFEENGLEYKESERDGFKLLRGANITYWVGDLCRMDGLLLGSFDFIYDRAAIIALPPAMRPLYATHLQSLLAPKGILLLISLEYDTQQMEGPPFSVPEAEIRHLFEAFRIEKLYDHDCLSSEPRFRERGLTWMRETVFLGRRSA